MTKIEFISAFKSACETLPGGLVDAALADYERQFTDQIISGVSEQVIVERWGTPQTAALKLKVGTFNGNLKQAMSAGKVARVGVSGVGLVFLDILLLGPAAIYSALLAAFYVVALLVYLTGIFVSASSLAGVSYIDVPAHYLLNNFAVKGYTHFDLADMDIVPTDLTNDDASPTAAGVTGVAEDSDHVQIHSPSFFHGNGFHIATHLNKDSIWKGISTTLAGIVLLVLCFLATGFTFRKLRQFVVWHFSVLKNA